MPSFFTNKKILICGGTGFVGTNLALKLVSLGATVRATKHNKEPQIQELGVTYVSCDLRKPEDCARVMEDIDLVFICAANTSGAAVMEKTPLVHVTPNVIMNSLILEAAYAAEVKKVLFISTNTVYPLSDEPVKETDMHYGDLFEKYYFVGWMKQFSEVLCEMYTKIKNPMKTVVVRPANIYGPYDDFEWETSHVLPALMRKVIERQDPLEVWGDGNDIKDFIYIDDFIEGMLRAMERINVFDPINIATGKESTIRQALKIMLATEGYENANVVFNSDKPSMIPKRLIDPTKAKQLLDFEAGTPLDKGIKRTMAWYKSKISQTSNNNQL